MEKDLFLRRLVLVLLTTVILSVQAVFAGVSTAGIFGDHMVLQQNRPVPVWGKADPNQEVTVIFNKQKKTVHTDLTGKWVVILDAIKADGPFEMTITCGDDSITFNDIYMGEVWLCSGQSNMDMTVAKEDRYWCGVENEASEVAAANCPLIRVFDVPFVTTDQTQDDVESQWEICNPKTVGHFSAAAYFFARDLQRELNVPIGLVTTAYGASTAEAWTSRAALEANPSLRFLIDDYVAKCTDYDSGQAKQQYEQELDKWKQAAEKAKAENKRVPRKLGKPKNPHSDQHSPCVLYNGMVAPLIPYAIRGAIWYQGESNGPTAGIYDQIMETMIKDWRSVWGQGDFPFLYVQLASYGKSATDPCQGGSTTEVRHAQLKNLKIPNTGMVVTIDIGDAANIHPKNKQAVGYRLALLARDLVYDEDIVSSGPIYDYMLIKGRTIELHFNNVGGGLKARDGKLEGFAIAGNDGKFVQADARIEGNIVLVSNPMIDKPRAVCYSWADNPVISLFNAEGLPASPFRTDY